MTERYKKLPAVEPSEISCIGQMPASARCERCGVTHWAPPAMSIQPRKVTCDCGLKLVWPDPFVTIKTNGPVTPLTQAALAALVERARAVVAAMTPEQRAAMWQAQREGWARGEAAMGDEGTRPCNDHEATVTRYQPKPEPRACGYGRQGNPSLTFAAFSEANLRRCENPEGFNHLLASWSTSDWMTAILGELGEAANIAKKLNRVRDGIPGNKESAGELRAKLRKELGDVFVYLDLTAQSLGFSIADAAVEVFNTKSEDIGYPGRLQP